MNSLQFNDIWQLLNDYTFEVDPDSIYEDLSCGICNKLMKDACHSVCGCQYCYTCINEYLLKGDNYCPGAKQDCKVEYLVMERDITRNVIMNKKISNLRVLCPNESCQSKIVLTQMSEHLRVCTKQPMECPYIIIGCNHVEETKDAILTHLNNEALKHTELFIDYMNNLKNEINGLKNNLENRIMALEEESRIKDEEMRDQRGEMDGLKEECMNKENRIAALEEELREVRNGMEIRIKREFAVERGEIERVMNNAMVARENFVLELRGLNKEITEVKRELGTTNDVRGKIMYNLSQLCPNVNADFIWTVNNIREKVESMNVTDMFSESFYVNNYKLCLRLFIHGQENIYVHCHIMRGDNDDIVEWPLKQEVKVSVIDQYTYGSHSSIECKYETYDGNRVVFDRPTNDRNTTGIGEFRKPLIKYSIDRHIPSIIATNRIIVACVLAD